MPLSPKRAGSVAYAAAMFLVVSVLAGVLIAGLFVPFAGVAGASSKAAVAELDNIPAELATPAPATRSKVLMGNGQVLAYFYDENRIPVTLNQIAPIMRQAQLAIEDHRFYEHGALDLKGTLRALIRNSAGGSTQGGSSISQQYVKMVQVEACEMKGDDACVKDVQAPTMERKIRELRYAIALEKRFTKDQILERYLNIAYYGEGAYGIQAAAKHYYNTDASKLTLPQAAMLAGLVQNPDNNNPVRNLSAALDRRDVVLNRMAELGIISVDQARQAKKATFDKSKVQPTRNGCVGTRYPFLCDYVRRTLLLSPSLGKSTEERANLLNRGGLTIQTAIDPKTQDLAQKSVSSVVQPTDPLISTMNMIQPATGLIVAMAQSRPVMGTDSKKGETYWNLSAPTELGGIQGYQAGSTFKAFTMAAALEKGIPISKKYDAKSPTDFSGRTYESCNGTLPVYGTWRVKNSVGHSHVIDMTEAAEFSVNTYWINLELDTGMCRVTKMAQKLGVKVGHRIGEKSVDIVKQYQDKPSFTLGTVEVAPLSMAEAYATFAARGIHCDPIIVSKITTRDGKQLDPPSANCKRVISEDVADGVNKVLKAVVDRGTGQRAVINPATGGRMPALQRDVAGKTGTIDSSEAVWFAGYTPDIAGVAMISIDNTKKPFIKPSAGHPHPEFRRSGVSGYYIKSTQTLLEGSGSGDAGKKIWRPTMAQYLKDIPPSDFHQPPLRILVGKKVQVPSLFGLGYAAAKAKLEQAGFTVVPQRTYSDVYPNGAFMGFSPGGGSIVPQFSTIFALTSAGRDPAKVAAEKKAKADAAKKAAEEAKKKQQQQNQTPGGPPTKSPGG